MLFGEVLRAAFADVALSLCGLLAGQPWPRGLLAGWWLAGHCSAGVLGVVVVTGGKSESQVPTVEMHGGWC